MSDMAIITPSYRPDFSLFQRLHESVVKYTEEDVMHHIIVPSTDAEMFRSIVSPRLVVWTHQDVLPPGLKSTDRIAAGMRRLPIVPSRINCAAINWHRPWIPVRGWLLQQILKLAIGSRVKERVLLFLDSDVVLVRPVFSRTFIDEQGAVRLYGKANAITPEMERHYQWSLAAHEILGLPWLDEGMYPDHVAGIVSWDREVLRRCLLRVEEVAGRRWEQVIAERRHFSEWMLYGTYVRHFGSDQEKGFQRESTLCHSYWSQTPMTSKEALEFSEGFTNEDVAVHVQSKSMTDQDTFRIVLERVGEEELG
ncbi:DUF6492 family protein [Citricoccus parietis]|uniref:DUF6492 family protein n=1 Tax=Citricoccus parietis TaxID=592307 RepID=A0ABV6F246_9MICC